MSAVPSRMQPELESDLEPELARGTARGARVRLVASAPALPEAQAPAQQPETRRQRWSRLLFPGRVRSPRAAALARFIPLLALTLIALLVLPAARPGPNTVLVTLADGFDYPVGKPDAVGYRKARGFWPGAHPGEDWNGKGGGNTDLGDPVYSIADGVVVASADYRAGWGNCVIVRHAYRDGNGEIRMVDSQYAHLDRRAVRLYQVVKRGDLVGTIGTAHGRYWAHLHFEIRKNLRIGMNRSQFPRDYNHYYNPTPFIKEHRRLRTSSRRYPIPTKTFAEYGEKTLPQASTRAPGSVVPVRPDDSRQPGRLDPELEKILEQNRGDAPTEEEMEGFWSRLREKLRGAVRSPKGN